MVIAKNVPTFAEAGYPQFDASFYLGIAARKFAEDASAVIDGSEFKARYLTNLGGELVGDTPEQFAALLVGDRALAEE